MTNNLIEFSVILPVFYKEVPERLKQAIQSLFDQTIIPDEIVIVLDGPIGDDLNNILDEFRNDKRIKIIKLTENMGVGVARKTAIKEAKHDILALMDSDDISCNYRFEKQLHKFKEGEFQVIGGWIQEFRNKPEDLASIRKLPSSHNEIYKFGKWRMPVNNVTLMFSREAYNRAGGYSDLSACEDYHLVVNLIATGSQFFNIPEILVHVRAGEDMITRRRDWTSQINALKIFLLMYKLKYIGIFKLFANVTLRISLRFLPIKAIAYLYKIVLRSKS